MANAIYPLALQAFLGGDIDLASDDIKCRLLTSAYSYSASHQYVDDLTGTLTDGVSGNLASKSITSGVFDAANVTFSSVTGSQTAAALVVYKDTGNTATSPLIAFFDTGTGFPFSTNGGDITVTWSDGANKIFALVNS